MPTGYDVQYQEIEHRLALLLGDGRFSTQDGDRALFSTDLYERGALCLGVARPADTRTLAQLVRAVTQAGLAVVPRGGGLTYVGGYTPDDPGYVAIDCSDLDKIVEINADDMYITVGAGVTWRSIHERLTPLGLRLPFFGTFSGACATVGGGLSNGAMFLGSARYGSAAEIVLGLEVVLADGTILRTGQGGITNGGKPFYRTYGPDLTGLFVHDSGAFGIKAQATFRLIRTPERLDYLSFLVSDVGAAAATLSEIARRDLVEEIYIVDPVRTRQRLQDGSIKSDLKMLGKVVAQEKGVLRGLRSGLDLIRGGRDFLDQDLYSIHLVCAGRSPAAVDDDIAACRKVALEHGGIEIPNSIPKASRAMPFADLAAILGTEGDRWVALNCKIAHSDARGLIEGVEAIFARHKPAMDAAGVVVTLLISAMSNHVFSYECVVRWFDRWLPLHRRSHPDLARFEEPADNPAARTIIACVRREVVDHFHRIGAPSSQIGRTYRYLDALEPEPLALIEGLKAMLDPDGRMNPGALGFAPSAAAPVEVNR